MSKQILKCKCPICGAAHELECDMLVPGVEGWIGSTSICDPTRTERLCTSCVSRELEKLVKEAADE